MPDIDTPPPGDWRDIDTIENVRQTAEFRFKDGREVRGQWEPYWCGSDCPCYALDDGPSEPLTSYPACWCVFEASGPIEEDPVQWRPVAA